MARFGRKEGLQHWLTLESWLGMVIDAVLIKAIDSSEEEESTIVVSMLGKKALELVHIIQSQFLSALDHQSVSLSFELVSTTTRLLSIATRRYKQVVRGEGPTPHWLKQYLSKDVIQGIYQAWDKTDLVWAVYSYYFWKEPKRTVDGLQSALIDLLKTAECGRKQRDEVCSFFGVTYQDTLQQQPPSLTSLTPAPSTGVFASPRTSRATTSLVGAFMKSSIKISPAPSAPTLPIPPDDDPNQKVQEVVDMLTGQDAMEKLLKMTDDDRLAVKAKIQDVVTKLEIEKQVDVAADQAAAARAAVRVAEKQSKIDLLYTALTKL